MKAGSKVSVAKKPIAIPALAMKPSSARPR